MKTKTEYIEVVRLVRIEYENSTARRRAIARAKESRFDSWTASGRGCFGVKHMAKVRVVLPNIASEGRGPIISVTPPKGCKPGRC